MQGYQEVGQSLNASFSSLLMCTSASQGLSFYTQAMGGAPPPRRVYPELENWSHAQ